MKRSPKWTLLSLMVGLALIDQLSKAGARLWLNPEASFPIIPDVFQLTLAYNTGAAFSMLSGQPQLLSAFTSLLFVALLAYGLIRTQFARGERLGMGLILGGALGNLIDRLSSGHVTDFLDVIVIHYPVFNLADTFIFCGVILMLLALLRPTPETTAASRSNTHEPQPPR